MTTYLPSPDSSDCVLSALYSTIETVQIVEGLIPLPIAKGILSTVASILTVVKVRIQHIHPFISLIFVQDTIQNKDDFAEVTNRCHDIGMVLWQATSATPEDEINPIVVNAICGLKE